MPAKPNELAVLTINGQLYQDWDTVMVRHARKESPFYYFRFTCSEGMPLAKNWAALRIRPGDWCEVTLAGQPAFSGMVHTRQVYYDGRRHYIEIQGASQVIALSYSAVVHKTMEYNNVTIEQYIRGLLRPFPKIKLIVIGGKLPTFRFPRLAIAHGTSVLEAIEVPLRSLGAIDLTSDVNGNLVTAVGTNGEVDTVTEGVDILEGREIIFQPGYQTGVATLGQPPGGDDKNGPDVTHKPFKQDKNKGSVGSDMPTAGVIPLEVPPYAQSMLDGRVNADRDWQNKDWITVYTTVHGWLRRDGKLWDRLQSVHVVSPMLIMNMTLDVRTVTFMQDNKSGTRTVLELCNKAAMRAYAPQGPQA